MLTDAVRRDMESRVLLGVKPTKPTAFGTAKIMNIHRDTLYVWLK